MFGMKPIARYDCENLFDLSPLETDIASENQFTNEIVLFLGYVRAKLARRDIVARSSIWTRV